ncbi:MAG: hypothetical protein Q3Y27_08510, partial [Clostridia bacterium]|nr:hypothetical protein [Clostridia bacterium]
AQQRHQELFGAALPEALGNGESPSFLEGKFFGENTLGKTRFYAFGAVESSSMEAAAPMRK